MFRNNRNEQLSAAQKGRILSLRFDQGRSISQICALMQTTKNTVRKWINRFMELDNVEKMKPPGRPRITTPEQDQEIVQYLRENTFSTATRAAALHAVPYCTATRRIRKSEIRNRIASNEIELTRRHRNERIRFAQYMLNVFTAANFEKIIFTDEKTFLSDKNGRIRVYRPKGERYSEQYVVKTSRSGHVSAGYWGWISFAGPGEIVPTGSNFNSVEYVSVLDEVAFPSIRAQFGDLNNIVYQHDNAPWHTAHIVRDHLRVNNVEVLNWPARSPDLNPIELVWAYMENTRSPLIQRNHHGLDTYVFNKWEDLRNKPEFFQNLYNGFRERLEYVIENDGRIYHKQRRH